MRQYFRKYSTKCPRESRFQQLLSRATRSSESIAIGKSKKDQREIGISFMF